METDAAPAVAAPAAAGERARPDIVILGRRFRLPRTRIGRQTLGYLFLAGGVLSFLPVLGPWMFPVGFAILSVDSPAMRRRRRRLTIKVGRQWPRLNAYLKAPARS